MEFQDLSLSRLRDLSELTATVAAAYQVGVFAALAEGPATAESLARELGLRERGLRILLPVLEELELLRSSDGRYQLTPETLAQLGDPDSEAFMGGGLPHWLGILRGFARLPEVLVEGGPVEEAEEQDETPEEERAHLARFMAAMAAAPAERIERIVDVCLDRAPDADTVLDLGGGPGHMARAFARRGCRVTLFDQPRTVEFVAEEYDLEGVEGLRLAGGDFLTDPLPHGPFDIVLMSNILHIYSPTENRRVLEKVAGVTAPGGVTAVADFFRGRSSRAARFALIMLLKTEGGNTYSEEEIAGWLQQAGFVDAVTADLDEERQLMTAVLPDGD